MARAYGRLALRGRQLQGGDDQRLDLGGAQPGALGHLDLDPGPPDEHQPTALLTLAAEDGPGGGVRPVPDSGDLRALGVVEGAGQPGHCAVEPAGRRVLHVGGEADARRPRILLLEVAATARYL